MIRYIFACSVTVAVVGAGPAPARAQSSPYTLDAVQRLALSNYETIRTAHEQVEQAHLLRRRARGVILPTVEVNSVLTRNLIPSEFEFSGQRITVLPGVDYNLSISVSQPLFAGLRDVRTMRQANLNVEMAGEALESTAQDALLEVTQAYYRVLGAQDNVEISRRALAVTDESLRVAESLYRAGEAIETAVLRARVAQSEARRELLQAENALVLARQQLGLLTGLEGEIEVTRPPRPAAFGLPLDALVRQSLATRAELDMADLQRRIAELEIEKRRGQYLPEVRAQGSFTQRRATFPSSRLSSVAINATWTLFDGGRTAADIATAASQVREAELGRTLLRKRTEQQVRTAYLSVETLAASVDMLTAQVEFARRNAETTQRAFRAGEATDLDLITANELVARSERQLSMTTYNLDVAMYELQRAVGTFAADLVTPALASGGMP